MKKATILFAFLLAFTQFANAQKWMTRTGKVTFFSTTPVENIEAFTNEAASVIDAKTGDLLFVVPIKSFKFEKALMQEHFNENYLESDKFPKAEFKGKINNLKNIDFSKDGTYDVASSGVLTIHGVSRDVVIPGTLKIEKGTATASSKFNVKAADYDIKIPAMAASKIAETMEVTVQSDLKAK